MENGWFTDFTLRGGQNKLNLTAKFADSSTVKISPERSFIALSAEGGRSYDFRRNGKGWKAEPKAELQFMNAGAADASVENGNGKVKFGGASYITAIASANGSYSFIRKNGMLIEPFGEMSYSQDISGTEKITYGNNSENSDMKGGTIELRLGLNMQMKQDLYWHAAASIESGSKKQSFGIDAGIRYMFGKKTAKTAEKATPDTEDEQMTMPETVNEDQNPAQENQAENNTDTENKETQTQQNTESQTGQTATQQDIKTDQNGNTEQPQNAPENIPPSEEPATDNPAPDTPAQPETKDPAPETPSDPDDDEDPFKFMLDF